SFGSALKAERRRAMSYWAGPWALLLETTSAPLYAPLPFPRALKCFGSDGTRVRLMYRPTSVRRAGTCRTAPLMPPDLSSRVIFRAPPRLAVTSTTTQPFCDGGNGASEKGFRPKSVQLVCPLWMASPY